MNILRTIKNGVQSAGRFIKRHLTAFVTGAMGLLAATAQAGTDATAITTAAEAAFPPVATLCVAIGTFYVVYRLAKRIK